MTQQTPEDRKMSRNSALQLDVRANLLAWIVDLETTDAKQAREALKRGGDSYCCLGRACEIAKVEWASIGSDEWGYLYESEDDDYGEVEKLVDDGELTWDLRKEFGIGGEDMGKLISMNDKEGKTFPEIAAWLRENVLPRYPEKGAVQP